MTKKEFHPLVSIVIPVYNGENYMKEAIDSALAQTYDNIEVIVVNDGSKDKTDEIAKSYGDKIKYYKKENGGAASALNYGISKMKGEYFSWLSHDDVYLPNKVQAQVDVLRTYDDKDVVVYSNVLVVDQDLNIISDKEINKKIAKNMIAFLGLDTETGLNGCSLLIPKKAFDDCGVFSETLMVTQDYDMWFRIAQKFDFIYCPDFIVKSRRHPSQDSKTKVQLCNDESDILHYNILNYIDSKDLIKYVDLDYLMEQYKIYRVSGYSKTAIIILKKMLENGYDCLYLIKDLLSREIIGNLHFTDSKKSKLVFYNNVFINGGIEKTLSVLFKELSSKYDIVFITTKYDKVNSPAIDVPVILIQEDSYINVNIISISMILGAKVFVGNPNIVESFVDIYELFKATDIKTVAYMHYNYFLLYKIPYLFPVLKKRMEKYSFADTVVWLTPYYNYLYSKFNDNGISIANSCPYETDVKLKKKFEKKLLSIGRFDDAVKRIDKLLLVFKEVNDLDSNFELTIVGNINKNSFKEFTNMSWDEFITKNNIPVKKINFEGEQKDVKEYYDNNSLFVGTSESEGFGMTFLEALSLGLPCAFLRINGLDEFLIDEVDSIQAGQNDIKGLAQKIVSLMNDNEKYLELSSNAKRIAKNFDKKIIGEKWTEVFERLINNKKIEKIKYDRINEYESYAIIDYENVFMSLINGSYVDDYQKQIDILQKDNIKLNKLLKESYENKGFFAKVDYVIRKYGPIGVIKRIFLKINYAIKKYGFIGLIKETFRRVVRKFKK